MDGHGAPERVDLPDEARSSSEPVRDFLADVPGAVRGRDGLDREIGCERDELLWHRPGAAAGLHEGAVWGADCVGVPRDEEPGFGGEDAAKTVLPGVRSQRDVELARRRTVLSSGRRHLSGFSSHDLPAPAVAAHAPEVSRGDQTRKILHGAGSWQG